VDAHTPSRLSTPVWRPVPRLRKACLFADPYTTETLTTHIRLLAMRHSIVVGALRQKRVQPVFDGPKAESINDIYGGLAGHWAWVKLKEAGRRIENSGSAVGVMRCAHHLRRPH
jgi:hypothetical protein